MLPVEQLTSLTLTLHSIGAVRFGTFTLHSGRTSPIYIDLRLLVSFPGALNQAAAAYRHILERLTFDLLAATPLAGLPIGTAICLDMGLPLIYPRQRSKSYGTGKLVEGKWKSGQKAVVVDDLITSGDSLLSGIVTLEEAGLEVTDTVVLIDREQGGREMLGERGYELHSLVTLSHLLLILERSGRITSRQRTDVVQTLNEGAGWYIIGWLETVSSPSWRKIMVSAIVLFTVGRGKINEVAETLADIKGVSEVYSVGGRYDLVAIIRVKNNEALAELVTNQMLHVKGITNSETLIAFRVFSRHDLESMFSIGM
jgi:orotate phosphoribosyltransferase